jgi:putative DNA primase/helicase
LAAWAGDLDDLADLLAHPNVGPKDGGYFVRGPFDDVATRADEHIVRGFAAILDGDKRIDLETGEVFEGAPHPDYVHSALIDAGVSHLLVTSHSHLDPNRGGSGFHRWRCIVPCELADAEELRAVVDYLIGVLHAEQVLLAPSRENYIWSQPWFVPRLRSPDAPFLSLLYDEGQPLDVAEIAAEYRKQSATSRPAVEPETAPRQSRTGSPISRFVEIYGEPEAIITRLESHGYVLKHTSTINGEIAYRLIRPGSASGIAGVAVFRHRSGSKWLVCSHHGSGDPLSGPGGQIQTHDAFDLFRILEAGGDEQQALRRLRMDHPECFVASAANNIPVHDSREDYAERSAAITTKEAWALIRAAEQIVDVEECDDRLLRVVAPQVYQSSEITEVDRRKLLGTIAKLAGATYGALKADLGAYDEVKADKDLRHLQAAREVVKAFGDENVITQSAFIWTWRRQGVWKRIDDREVKSKIHEIAGSNELTKGIADSVLDLFKTETFLPDHAFDQDTSAINLLNGELYWDGADWDLRAHNREHYRTTQLAVRYDPSAKAPRFQQFLSEIFDGDVDGTDKAKTILQMLGYSLLTTCRYERFIILVGSGANGKSVLLSVVTELLGRANVAAVQPCQFDNRFQRAHLFGKLANIVVEIAEGAEIADAALKSIVSGELTTAEHKHKPPFDFTPFATCWFGTNHMPHTRDFSDAMFRRAFVIPFNRKFEGESCDEHLKEKLVAERSGILNLALGGLAEVLTQGFAEPESCIRAKHDWRLQCDQVARFVEDCCEARPGTYTTSQVVFDRYRTWALAEGITRMLGKNAVSTRLRGLGFEPGHDPSRQSRVIWGIKLR